MNLLPRLQKIAENDAFAVNKKNIEYGESWCKRGGQQAFAVIWRKVDRVESILEKMNNGYDVFEAWRKNPGDVQDDLRDLRQYLLLLEEYCTRRDAESLRSSPGAVDPLEQSWIDVQQSALKAD